MSECLLLKNPKAAWPTSMFCTNVRFSRGKASSYIIETRVSKTNLTVPPYNLQTDTQTNQTDNPTPRTSSGNEPQNQHQQPSFDTDYHQTDNQLAINHATMAHDGVLTKRNQPQDIAVSWRIDGKVLFVYVIDSSGLRSDHRVV